MRSPLQVALTTVNRLLTSGLPVLWMAFLLYFLLGLYRFAFNYETGIIQYYTLSWVALVCALFFAVANYFFTDSAGKQVVFAVGGAVLGACCYYYGCNEYRANIISFLLIAMTILLGPPGALRLLIGLWVAAFCFECIYGGLQLYLGSHPTGTLLNTGVYALFITSQLPMIHWIISGIRVSRQRWLLWLLYGLEVLVYGVVFYLVSKVQARTAMGCWCVVVGVLLVKHIRGHYRAALSWWMQVVCVVGGLGVLLYSAYLLLALKKMSVYGRAFLSKVALAHAGDHFWTGTGLGKFTWYYPQWQAAYIKDHPLLSANDTLSAGENYILLNEYIQLWETVGVWGMGIFVVILGLFYRTRSVLNRELLYTLKLTVTVILIAGVTSYPFHINAMLLLLVFCMGHAFRMNEKLLLPLPFYKGNVHKGRRNTMAIIAIAVSVYFSTLVFNRYAAAQKWAQLQDEVTEAGQQVIRKYDALMPALGEDGKFLGDYGMLLAEEATESKHAVQFLEKARQSFISKALVESLGAAYWKNGDIPKAIDCFTWLSYYLPGQCRPKLYLMRLYKQMGDIETMKFYGRSLLATTTKVTSTEVSAIRYEATQLLENSTR